jgi:hypothetical protein
MNNVFVFIKPTSIVMQAFAGQTSTESRLVGSMPLVEHTFDIDDYNNKFFYYNRIHRAFGWHTNPYVDDKIGLDHCGDCAIMCQVFETYCRKYGLPNDVPSMIRDVLAIIGRNLYDNLGLHGYYFKKYKSADDVCEQFKHM